MDRTTLIIIILIIVLGLFIGTNVVLQIIRLRKSQLGKILRIFNNLKYNEKLSRKIERARDSHRFKTGGWEKNREQLDFLPEELRTDLEKVFKAVTDVNRRIEAGGDIRAGFSMVSGDVEKLQMPITETRATLEKWVYANMNNPEFAPKRRGWFW